MKNSARLVALVLAFGCLTGTLSAAGELDIEVRSFSGTTPADLAVDASGLDGITVARKTPSSFTVTFGEAAQVTAELTLAIKSPPTGQAPFSLNFNVPFYWTDAARTELTAVLVPTELGGRTALRVIEDENDKGSLSARVMLNQRSRVAFRRLREQMGSVPRDPGTTDAMVALVFLQTSKELAYQDFVSPDPEMESVASWLESKMQDATIAARLFPNLKNRTDAEETLRQLKLSEFMQRQLLVDAIAAGVDSRNVKIRTRTCPRAIGLNDFYLEQAVGGEPATDAERRREIKNLARVAICRYHDLPSTPIDDTALVETATAVRDQMADLLTAYYSATDLDCGIVRHARARIGELEQRLTIQSVPPLASDVWVPASDPCAKK